MAKLTEHYSDPGGNRKEAPDHISEMLRSLILQESVEEANDLISYCLIPGLKKMIDALKDGRSPYREVLHAVLLTLQTNDRKTCDISDQFPDYAYAAAAGKKR